jgi:SAM-dependent methyltransferase
MYSMPWFDTFASAVPEAATAAEIDAVARLAPPLEYRRLLDVGCGIGRTAAPLAGRGYQVTGLDTSADALRTAARAAPGAQFVALDQRHIGQLRWTFDVVLILWNSFGFGDRSGDRLTLQGIRAALRPGGRLLLDLYHPDWLAAHEQSGVVDDRGATIDRWVERGRSMHRIRYADGHVDHIGFNIYQPEEIRRVLDETGFTTQDPLVWWETELVAGPEFARYQVVGTRAA